MITPDGTMKASVISALGGEGLNVPTDNGSHSFIIEVKQKGALHQDMKSLDMVFLQQEKKV